MSPLGVMRLMGWVLLVVGLLFTGIAVAGLVLTLSAPDGAPWTGWLLLPIGLGALVAGARYVFRTPSRAELERWTSRTRR